MPVGQAAAAVSLFPATVRAGHQPAYRSVSRADGDVADQLHRDGAKHSRRKAGELPHAQAHGTDADEPRPGKTAEGVARRLAGDHAADAVPGERGWRRFAAGAGKFTAKGIAGGEVGIHAADPVGPWTGRGIRAHPELAGIDRGTQPTGAGGNAVAGGVDYRIG